MARVKGTGLGLFIVRSVVSKHGGRVFAESEGAGRGSTFTIQLPRVEGAQAKKLRTVPDETEKARADGAVAQPGAAAAEAATQVGELRAAKATAAEELEMKER